ncbi:MULTISPECIES: hypothetical protein [Pseudoalteromonas]|uniref:hypothetical protein n=1 Tax=Pseudoalteromonas TaxID=53246 RepID=UPI000AD1B452|nr:MULTISPECIES: hypothetical protein [Pseudoalteromonas]MBE0375969.1 hypothetical protein [Pseudoalteromonas flavipulchra NCIMB 2033 = ATCC BAA-314]
MKSLLKSAFSTNQKEPKNSTLERSLCKRIHGGSGMSKGDGVKPQAQKADSKGGGI